MIIIIKYLFKFIFSRLHKFILLSIRIDGLKAGNLDYKINFVIPDREEVASTEIKRGIFRYLNDELAEDAAVTVTMPKEILFLNDVFEKMIFVNIDFLDANLINHAIAKYAIPKGYV